MKDFFKQLLGVLFCEHHYVDVTEYNPLGAFVRKRVCGMCGKWKLLSVEFIESTTLTRRPRSWKRPTKKLG